MNKDRRDQEAINSLNLSMPLQQSNNIDIFPYYGPDIQAYNNYQKFGYMNNIQVMNGYSNYMEYNLEESHLNIQNDQENKSTPINKNISPQNSEKAKMKPYLNYLFNTVTNLLNEGKITMKYLKEKSGHNNIIRNSEYHSTPTLKTLGTSSKPNNMRHKNLYENSLGKNYSNNSIKNIREKCENTLCNYIFNSNKDIIKIKIKGLKTQEKKLCKKCCEAVEKGYYCYYCNAIYRYDMSDSAKWVECDFCKKWVHFDCELSKGKRFNSTKELNDVKKYMCPICSNEKDEKRSIDNKKQKKLITKKRKGEVLDEQKFKKNPRKDLRNLKNEKYSELLADIQLIESFNNCK